MYNKIRTITSGMAMAALGCLLMLCGCADGDDGRQAEQQPNAADRYINLTIAVSNGTAITRAGEEPQSGEDGDGREAGLERENAVTGITLILYRDAAGINTTANPTLELVRFFPVSFESRQTAGTNPTIEAVYTTGNQLLGKPGLDFTATYHAIVIANVNLLGTLTEGVSRLDDVRNLSLSRIYNADETAKASACTGFIMSSEEDNTINFGSVTPSKLDDDWLYDLTDQPLLIERMAARIDFWARGSLGYDATNYPVKGYVYQVQSSADRFVVTGITPFNLTHKNATFGSEYVVKRLYTDLADATTKQYLADESGTNYVADPQTTDKTLTPALTNSLETVRGLTTEGAFQSNAYYKSAAALHADLAAGGFANLESLGEDVIVCYPMENALRRDSKLYYYATGIAIEGYYYVNGTGTGERRVYCGYLRHQGESATAYAVTTEALSTDATTASLGGPAMNFGIVRNNIYRVSIGSIDKKTGMKLTIEVKKWTKFEHKEIVM